MIRRASAPHGRRVGVLTSASIDADLVAEVELVQCCHCQFTTAYAPGLERRWGVCWRCSDWHCEKPACAKKCVPVKRWLENMAAGKPADHAPIQASVPGAIGGEL